jgi:hypothetical protein
MSSRICSVNATFCSAASPSGLVARQHEGLADNRAMRIRRQTCVVRSGRVPGRLLLPLVHHAVGADTPEQDGLVELDRDREIEPPKRLYLITTPGRPVLKVDELLVVLLRGGVSSSLSRLSDLARS